MLGLLGFTLLFWRGQRAVQNPNLLLDPDFRTSDWSAWQLLNAGDAQALFKPVTAGSDQTVIELTIDDAPQGNWVGIGQQVMVEPLRRYQLVVDYRLLYEAQSSAKLVMRVTQFDAAGEVIEEQEFSNQEAIEMVFLEDTQRPAWHSLRQSFVTDHQTVKVQVGFGLFGRQATVLEIINPTLKPYPTWLAIFRQDGLALSAVLLLILLLSYLLGQMLWPVRRKLLLNGSLAMTSVLIALGLAEIAIRFIPINLVSPNWPNGFHVPLANGRGYRLAKNYPATWVIDSAGDRHVVMSNSLGVRDIDLPPAEAPLMLVLGDSMTFGWAIDDIHDTWPRRLDEELAGLEPALAPYHLINAGVSGYNTFQEVALLEEILADPALGEQSPQLVLLSFFSGIWERNAYGPDGRFTVLNGAIMYTMVKEQLLILPGRLIHESGLDDLKVIDPDRLNRPHQRLLLNSRLYFVLSLLIFNQLDHDWDTPVQVDLQEMNYLALRSFKDMAEAHGIQPVVAYLPADNLFRPTKIAEHQQLVARLAAICAELNVPFINPYDNMQRLGINGENSKEVLTLVYNAHYSPQGNTLYAKALAPLLAEYLLKFQTNAITPLESKN